MKRALILDFVDLLLKVDLLPNRYVILGKLIFVTLVRLYVLEIKYVRQLVQCLLNKLFLLLC